MSKIVPVIMSGGAGSRLWPLSREAMPKQLLPLTSSQTMIQETVGRFGTDQFAAPVFICNARHVDEIEAQMDAIGETGSLSILEPAGRNTAPCAVVAAQYVKQLNLDMSEDQLVLLAPADHHISDPDAFQAAIKRAVPVAEAGYIVTFGIEPTGPETGYGYIAKGDPISPGVFQVKAFREKPDLDTAKAYVESGDYSWNAGIFLFSPKTFLEAAEAYAPEITRQASKALFKARIEGRVIELDADSFSKCPSDSIDYAVMEKSNRVAVAPCDMGWNDIGSFQSLHSLLKSKGDNENGNVQSGPVKFEGTQDCYVSTDSLPVSLVGVKNLAVIVRDGEVLVLDLDASQDVKSVVTDLKNSGETKRL